MEKDLIDIDPINPKGDDAKKLTMFLGQIELGQNNEEVPKEILDKMSTDEHGIKRRAFKNKAVELSGKD